ncbi:MAG: tetratricopeptide repeat protein [Candidatus Latescibacteria bacterium]|nr:tetratricopeptide repeat protein [Candidatus Latescibacterota bacterium]NIO78547.1 tetratricopeptide repeat protein [Candidatus Latescibacterota bacterium]
MPDAVPPGASGSPSQMESNVAADSTLSIAHLLKSAREAAEWRNFSKAEALYRAILIRERQNLDAILELAAVYEATGKLEHARGLLLRASVLRPQNRAILAKSVEITTQLSSTLHLEVDSLIARGQCELAIPKLSMLLTMEPENSELYYKKALCHLELKRPEFAIQVIDDALKLEQNEAYYKLRSQAHELLQKEQITDLIRQTIQLMRRGSPKDKEAALEFIGKILKIDPEQEWAKQAFLRLTSGEEDIESITEETELPDEVAAQASSRLGRARRDVLDALSDVMVSREILLSLSIALFLGIAILAYEKLKNFALQPPLSGRLSYFSLKQVLTLLNADARTGVIKVRSKGLKGEIYFENGEARHCEAGKLKGVDALSALLEKSREGYFEFADGLSSFKKTIDTPLSLILMGIRREKVEDKRSAAHRRPKSKMRELLESKK